MITPAQCRMARAALEPGVRELATLADVSAMSETRFESGHSQAYPETLGKMAAALEAAGVIFVAGIGDGPGVHLRKAAPGAGDLTLAIQALARDLASIPTDTDQSPEAALHTTDRAIVENEPVELRHKRERIRKAKLK